MAVNQNKATRTDGSIKGGDATKFSTQKGAGPILRFKMMFYLY